MCTVYIVNSFFDGYFKPHLADSSVIILLLSSSVWGQKIQEGRSKVHDFSLSISPGVNEKQKSKHISVLCLYYCHCANVHVWSSSCGGLTSDTKLFALVNRETKVSSKEVSEMGTIFVCLIKVLFPSYFSNCPLCPGDDLKDPRHPVFRK